MAGCAVMLMRAEQSLPTAGSNTTKQACVVLLQEMKFDHQDQKQACWPPMPGTRPHMLRSICGRIASLTLCTFLRGSAICPHHIAVHTLWNQFERACKGGRGGGTGRQHDHQLFVISRGATSTLFRSGKEDALLPLQRKLSLWTTCHCDERSVCPRSISGAL